jgi:hypothetical protein
MATYPLPVLSEVIVVPQLFAGSNLPQADQPQPFSNRPKHEVWLATVIDQFGSVTACGAVDRPVRIKPSKVVQTPASAGGSLQKATSGFSPGDSFSRIFNDFASRRDILGRKYAQPVNSGTADAQLERGGFRNARLGPSGKDPATRDTHQERGSPPDGRQFRFEATGPPGADGFFVG